MRFGKHGVSAVIASVFMILLVLVLASLIFSWARGLVGERTERDSLSSAQLCSAVRFDIAVVDKYAETYDFEVVNTGNVNISSLKFKIYPGGDSNIVDSNVGVLAGGSITGSVILSEPISRVEVLPVLDGGRSEVVCAKSFINLDGLSG